MIPGALTVRMVVTGALLAVVVGATFAFLPVAPHHPLPAGGPPQSGRVAER